MPTLKLSLGHPTVVLALRELSREDLTVVQLGPLLGLKPRQSYRICEWLRGIEPRIVCIKGWQHSHKGTTAVVYGLGEVDIPFIKLPKTIITKRHKLHKWALATIKQAHRVTINPKKLEMAYEVLLVLRHNTSIRQVGLPMDEDP